MARPTRPDAVSVISTLLVVALLAMVAYATWRDTTPALTRWQPLVGTPGAASSSRADLARSADALRARLADEPGEPGATVALAAVLLRQARVDSNPALAREAETVVRTALDRDPLDYQTRRTLATVLLSQHRFREAIVIAEETRALNPDDAWNHGVIGDASLELGEYDAAWAAYDTMMRIRPSAQAYARVAHALELSGDLERALERDGWTWEEPQPGALARLLGDRDRRADEAVALAEQALAHRRDIFSEDALAWACFRAGRMEQASAASARALRTGTRDRRILYHAAAIRHALDDDDAARELLDRALDGHPTFDLVNAPAARALRDALASPDAAD